MTQAQADHQKKMLELARQWRESGASAKAFAQEHGITTWTLYYWRQRAVRHERASRHRRRPRRARLAPVHVVAAGSDRTSELEIVLATGDRVRASAAVSAEQLRRVIEVLRAGC